MTVLNNFDVGGGEIGIFFEYNNQLRYLSYDGDNFELGFWQPTNAMVTPGNTVAYMTSATWQDSTAGVWGYAVFWSASGGGVWMAHNENGAWYFDGQLGGVTVGGGKHFTVGVVVANEQYTADIFTEDGAHYQLASSSSLNINGFSNVGSYITDGTSMTAVAGQLLDFAAGQWRFFSINDGQLTASEYDGGVYAGNVVQYPSAGNVLSGNVSTIATTSFASASESYTNVFALVSENGQIGINGVYWTSSTGWSQSFTVANNIQS